MRKKLIRELIFLCTVFLSFTVCTPLFAQSSASEAKATFPGEQSEWEGFVRYDFQMQGRLCIVVLPHEAAEGRPWMWRARFFGHEPQADVALLKKGFHVVFIDGAGLMGNDEALANWDVFYEFLVGQHGLAKKAALEGMSRGGLFIYNWGGRNPEKITCIYADAPSCGFQRTRSPSKDEPWVDNTYLIEQILRPLAQADIPLLHICGDADKVVSFERNTLVVEKRYKELGGDIKLIVKEGVGHHPHSLEDPTLIVEFVLAATKAAGIGQ